jgi:UDP-2-acetamido-3-amino-2,3-dideoxy-glucuronate N-acetyltransferase
MDYFVHPLADVKTDLIGQKTNIWQFCVVLPNAKIGSDVNLCSHCFVENDVIIGDRVTIKSGVQLWDGLRVGDDVFIGPNVSFTNDKFPRSKIRLEKLLSTIIDSGASIGAGSVILPGITIGKNVMIGAGSVVTSSIPENAIVVGNPSKIIGYVDLQKNSITNKLPLENKAASFNKNVSNAELINLPVFSDIRGQLIVGEFNKAIPFNVKRYFTVFNVPSSETRGAHAHKECHEFLICVKGSVSVLVDDGINKEEYLLNNPREGLYIKPMTWTVQSNYSLDAVLIVFASDHYYAEDYIRNYDEFIDLVKH